MSAPVVVRIGFALAALVAAVALTLAGRAEAAQPADLPSPPAPPAFDVPADDTPPDDTPPPVQAGDGAASLMPPPDLRGEDAPTAYERFGVTAISQLHVDLGNLPNTVNASLNALAQVAWGWTVALGGMVLAMVQWVYSIDLVGPLMPTVSDIVGALADSLYWDLLTPWLILAGAWAAWKALVRRQIAAATQGVVWTMLLAGLTIAFLARPVAVTDAAHQAAIDMSNATLSVLATVGDDSGIGTGLVASQTILADDATYTGAGRDQLLRTAADGLYRQLLLTPWATMHFGSTGAATQHDHASTLLDSRVVEDGETPGSEQNKLRDLKSEMEQEDHRTIHAWFNGHRASDRLVIAGSSFVAMVAVGVLLGAIALAILAADIGYLLLIVTAPIFLLLGLFPATRHVAVRWGHGTLAMLVRRVGYGIYLGIVLVVYGAVAQTAPHIGWLMAVAVQIVLLVLVWTQRRRFIGLVEAAAPGGQAIEDDTGRRVGGALRGAAVAAAGYAGGSTGAAVATQRAHDRLDQPDDDSGRAADAAGPAGRDDPALPGWQLPALHGGQGPMLKPGAQPFRPTLPPGPDGPGPSSEGPDRPGGDGGGPGDHGATIIDIDAHRIDSEPAAAPGGRSDSTERSHDRHDSGDGDETPPRWSSLDDPDPAGPVPAEVDDQGDGGGWRPKLIPDGGYQQDDLADGADQRDPDRL